MEGVVKDAILEEDFADRILWNLIEITMAEITTGRPLFQTLREEPVFYRRHFRRWVEEAMGERSRLAELEQRIHDEINGV
jgi:hypothetical protein